MVLESIRGVSRSCSPPIPTFPPIREVLAHGDAAAREISDHGNCAGRKGAFREDAHRWVLRFKRREMHLGEGANKALEEEG